MGLPIFWQGGAAPPITGTVVVTDALDAVAASGRLALPGVVVLVDAGDAVAAAGGLLLLGAASLSDAFDAVAAGGGLVLRGTAGTTDALDSASGAAVLVLLGSADLSDGVDTMAALGSVAGGAGPAPRRFAWLEAAADAPVVAHSLMESLLEQYGPDRARHVYFAMEREQKGPFAPGNEYDATKRQPQPVIVAKSRQPPPHGHVPKPVPQPSEDALRRFVAEKMRRQGR